MTAEGLVSKLGTFNGPEDKSQRNQNKSVYNSDERCLNLRADAERINSFFSKDIGDDRLPYEVKCIVLDVDEPTGFHQLDHDLIQQENLPEEGTGIESDDSDFCDSEEEEKEPVNHIHPESGAAVKEIHLNSMSQYFCDVKEFELNSYENMGTDVVKGMVEDVIQNNLCLTHLGFRKWRAPSSTMKLLEGRDRPVTSLLFSNFKVNFEDLFTPTVGAHIKSLTFYSCGITSEKIPNLIGLIQTCPQLEKLSLD